MISSTPKAGDRITGVSFQDDRLVVDFFDGRSLSVPLAWYPKLLHAAPQQRDVWQLCAAGYGIHWPELDEDLSAQGLLLGQPSARPHSLAA